MIEAPALPAFAALMLATSSGKHRLRIIVAFQAARTACRLGLSGSIAILVGGLVMQQPVAPWLVALPLALLLPLLIVGWAIDRLQADAEANVSGVLRKTMVDRLRLMSVRQLQDVPVGRLVTSIQRHPEAIAALVIGQKAAVVMMAVGPLMAAAAIIIASWQAALLVVGLTPVMIVFFVLVGDAIRRRAEAQESAFGQLAGQFADRIRTLPTILANHALAQEEQKLGRRLDAYANNTMAVLRIAFVNAAIIDFFASMSIAMLAVFLGLGHLKLVMIPGFSNLDLWQSLFILMIAPEYFAPYRRFAELYHTKAEGMAAASALDGILDRHHAGQPAVPALDAIPVRLPAAGLVALVGPSGAGKSTLLRRIAGIEPGHAGFAGAIAGRGVSWISTDNDIHAGSLAENIRAGHRICETRLKMAAAAVGLLDDALLPGGLNASVSAGGGNLSGGQRLRVSVARAMLSGSVVLADEPTAKLDAQSAALVRRALQAMSASRLVVVATHDPDLADFANQTIDLTPEGELEAAA